MSSKSVKKSLMRINLRASVENTAAAHDQLKVSVRTKDEAAKKAKAVKAVRATASVIESASVADVDSIMDRLLAMGEIRLDGSHELVEPDGEEEEDLADADDSEFEWMDDDQEPCELEQPLQRGEYVIRVQGGGDGQLRCDPPYAQWAGAQGIGNLGKQYLKNYHLRFQIYAVLTECLTRDYAEKLRQGPKALSQVLGQQKVFLQTDFMKGRSIRADALSRALNNCVLQWDDDIVPTGGETMPIRQLFAE